MMQSNHILLLTANVGSLFGEDADLLQSNWIEELKKKMASKKPVFIGIHFQEVGGKTHDTIVQTIEKFLQCISSVLTEFDRSVFWVDQEASEERYTAMACSYFVHKLFFDVEYYNFETRCFCQFDGHKETRYITQDSLFIKKFKFPLSCFSKNLSRIPRKGFLWSKWKIAQRTFDIVNVHLPHDACNIRASLKSSSKFAKYRRNTLIYMLDKIKLDKCDHQLLFGDFNVRPNTKGLVELISQNESNGTILETRSEREPNSIKIVAKTGYEADRDILTIEERLFKLTNYSLFNRENVPNIVKYDQELEWLKQEENYQEFPILFQPTYPHKEDPDDDTGISFSSVRCPSWCDRILVDSSLFEIISRGAIEYDSYGMDSIIGDHKPVFLSFNLPNVI